MFMKSFKILLTRCVKLYKIPWNKTKTVLYIHKLEV